MSHYEEFPKQKIKNKIKLKYVKTILKLLKLHIDIQSAVQSWR